MVRISPKYQARRDRRRAAFPNPRLKGDAEPGNRPIGIYEGSCALKAEKYAEKGGDRCVEGGA